MYGVSAATVLSPLYDYITSKNKFCLYYSITMVSLVKLVGGIFTRYNLARNLVYAQRSVEFP